MGGPIYRETLPEELLAEANFPIPRRPQEKQENGKDGGTIPESATRKAEYKVADAHGYVVRINVAVVPKYVGTKLSYLSHSSQLVDTISSSRNNELATR